MFGVSILRISFEFTNKSFNSSIVTFIVDKFIAASSGPFMTRSISVSVFTDTLPAIVVN